MIILFLFYFYKNHLLCGRGRKPKTRRPLLNRGMYTPVTRFSGEHVRTYKPSSTLNPTFSNRESDSDSDSDSDEDEDCEDDGTYTRGLLADQELRRQRAKQIGIFEKEDNGNIFTKTSLQIINEKTDEEAGTFGTLFRTEKALDMKDYILSQPVYDNEFLEGDNIEAEILLGTVNDCLGERSLVSRAEDESREVILSQINSRIMKMEGMTTEGVTTNTNTIDGTQVQVVSNKMLGGRPPASADLKKLAYESNNEVVSKFLAGLAARDIENRKNNAGNSQGSYIDQAPIASDYY